jgi:MSHA pilin protein MshA
MKAKQTGFTLIELVMVIVILGILAVVALPRFVDLGGQARTAAAEGIAGALSSAAATNFAARQIPGAVGTVAVANCADVGPLLQGGLPAGYTITSQAIAPPGTTVANCVVTGPNASTANFTATAIN